MNNTEHTTCTDSLIDSIDALASAGFTPIDCHDEDGMTARTIDYFAIRGWDAVRFDGERLTFARFATDDTGPALMATTPSGCISSEATFDGNRQGLAWFHASAQA